MSEYKIEHDGSIHRGNMISAGKATDPTGREVIVVSLEPMAFLPDNVIEVRTVRDVAGVQTTIEAAMNDLRAIQEMLGYLR